MQEKTISEHLQHLDDAAVIRLLSQLAEIHPLGQGSVGGRRRLDPHHAEIPAAEEKVV